MKTERERESVAVPVTNTGTVFLSFYLLPHFELGCLSFCLFPFWYRTIISIFRPSPHAFVMKTFKHKSNLKLRPNHSLSILSFGNILLKRFILHSSRFIFHFIICLSWFLYFRICKFSYFLSFFLVQTYCHIFPFNFLYSITIVLSLIFSPLGHGQLM